MAGLIIKNKKPDIAIDFHNDALGPLFFAASLKGREKYIDDMKTFLKILREKTWFKDGSVIYSRKTSSTFDEGLLKRYGIEALVYELNVN